MKSSLPLSKIAELVQGTLRGTPEVLIKGLSSLEESDSTCISFSNAKTLREANKIFESTKAAAILLDEALLPEISSPTTPVIFVKNPLSAIICLIPHFVESTSKPTGISDKADIDPSAEIHPSVSIGAFSVIGKNVVIEEGVTIHPQVVIYEGARIGKNTIIHSGTVIRENVIITGNSVIQNGAVIGADGFGYVPDPICGLRAVPQVGTVKMAQGVDVGANSCIDRATLGSTRIGFGTKIDNLVQIGHNVSIGMHSIVCGLAGISGSCTIGNQVIIGGNAGIADHLSIVDGARFAAKCGVIGNITKKADYAGYPHMEAHIWRRAYAALSRLAKKHRNSDA